jgi:hypothetical protein
MKIFLLSSLLAAFQLSLAFHVVPERQTQSLFAMKKKGGEMSYPAMEFQENDPDLERAKDCAEHFGKCSVKEMKQLKQELHQKRIQSLVFGDTAGALDDIFQEHLLEEELTMQLNLLQDEMPPAYLFPEVEDPMEELPHLKDGTVAARVKEDETAHYFEELAEEGVLESLAICGLIGMLMLAPALLQ